MSKTKEELTQFLDGIVDSHSKTYTHITPEEFRCNFIYAIYNEVTERMAVHAKDILRGMTTEDLVALYTENKPTYVNPNLCCSSSDAIETKDIVDEEKEEPITRGTGLLADERPGKPGRGKKHHGKKAKLS